MADSNSSKHQQSFAIKDLKCQKVVVFTDRAEVKRVLKTKLKKGENEVTLTGVTSSIDQDSVRVEGHGNATVVDVVCQTKAVTEFKGLDSADSRIKDLKNEIKSLEEQIEKQKQKLERNERQTSILNDFAATLSKPVSVSSNNGGSQVNSVSASSAENVNNFINFLGTYSTKVEALDAEKLILKKEIKELEDKLTAAHDNLNRQVGYETYTTNTDVSILLESAGDDNEIELIVSYLVYSASWSPKYDIRVFSKEKSMNINYFGMIVQSTGEDWNDVKLSLSTAVPSIGGNVPELETQNVRVRQPIQHYPMPQMKSKRMEKVVLMDYAEECDMMPQAAFAARAPVLEMARAEVSQSTVGSTATFDIARNSTIPADGNTHKVSIGLITLKPEFEYQTVPRKNAHAYLKAKVTNSSQYPLLAGPANVFLDQNFVSKIDLKSYSPQEEFDCSLGVDPGIRVDYKPVRKFKSESGLLSKSTSTSYEQEIEVKNTTPNAAKILLSENLPLSNDDKIQVKLVEPSLKNNANVKLNKKNNLEFEMNIPANKAETIKIKYSVDHPSDKEIEFF